MPPPTRRAPWPAWWHRGPDGPDRRHHRHHRGHLPRVVAVDWTPRRSPSSERRPGQVHWHGFDTAVTAAADGCNAEVGSGAFLVEMASSAGRQALTAPTLQAPAARAANAPAASPALDEVEVRIPPAWRVEDNPSSGGRACPLLEGKAPTRRVLSLIAWLVRPTSRHRGSVACSSSNTWITRLPRQAV
jgi:hypothetical protein